MPALSGLQSERDGNLINVAPFQLGEEVLWIHSARPEGEALVTAALYLDTRDLKSACNVRDHLAFSILTTFS